VSTGAIVLAAGHGTRMRSALPKVLHPLAGRPMIAWVMAALADIPAPRCVVVVGPEGEAVPGVIPDGARVAVQEERLGTGHATQVGLAALPAEVTTVVVACGDTPLLRPGLIRALVEEHERGGCAATMVTAILDDAAAYGRVVRDAAGLVVRVVEARDASPSELAIPEINAGLYAFDRRALDAALAGVGRDNAQGEVYLPDALPLLGGPVAALVSPDADVVHGVNTRVDLAECEAVLQDRLRRELMLGGVTMPDPTRVWVDAGVTVGQDTVLWPGTMLRGGTRVGAGCEIGPDAVLADTVVEDGARLVSVHAHSARVGPGCQVGPFAYLRPGTVLAEGAKVGTYVETKNAEIGPGAKVPHLSYMGDVSIGAGSNIGAGNITGNYDGFRKHRTEIGAGVKTGSDCVFVAPVRVGDGAMTGAGSIITGDVPDGALGIARARQSNIEGFSAKAAARAARAATGHDAGA
jgi:bifunctional UDP-N-acetylglucosamine pyrophosphorylase/glucosamine-1-phosphate N-acetyltransferase